MRQCSADALRVTFMQAELKVLPLSPVEFSARVVPALLDREAENGLPLGIAARLMDSPEDAKGLLFSIEAAGIVLGAAVWTPPHDVVVTRLPEGAAQLLAERCLRSGHAVTGASGPERSGLELAEQLARQMRVTVQVRMRQLLYELLEVHEVPLASGRVRRALREDLSLVASYYAEFVQEVSLAHPGDPRDWARGVVDGGAAFVWEDCGAVRSLACLSRETPNGRAIGPVYTPPATRRLGYATSLVSELARTVLASGKRFACLFTDASNPTSNHIYEAIGFRCICRYDAYRLVSRG